MFIYIEIKAVPASGRQQCIIDGTGQLKCYLKSTPEGGKANTELVKMLSKKLRIPQYNIALVSGATTRKKRIKIKTELSKEKIEETLVNAKI